MITFLKQSLHLFVLEVNPWPWPFALLLKVKSLALALRAKSLALGVVLVNNTYYFTSVFFSIGLLSLNRFSVNLSHGVSSAAIQNTLPV